MGRIEKLIENTYVRHFKRELVPSSSLEYLYKILCIARHSETGEKLVIYSSVKDPSKVCARPLDMFTSLVDVEKYPEIKQKYRFETVNSWELQLIGSNETLYSDPLHAAIIKLV